MNTPNQPYNQSPFQQMPSQPAGLRHEDEKLYACLSHLSFLLNAIVPFGGLLAAYLLWNQYKTTSKFIASHASQAFGFQLIGIIFGIIAVILMVVIFFVSIFLGVGSALVAAGAGENAAPVAGGIAMIIFIVIWLIQLLAILILFAVGIGSLILGIMAAIKAYKGEFYTYPFVGKRAARLLKVQ